MRRLRPARSHTGAKLISNDYGVDLAETISDFLESQFVRHRPQAAEFAAQISLDGFRLVPILSGSIQE